MSASAGDYRVTDPTSGSEWSVTPEAFGSGYASVGGDQFESRGTVLAHQVGEAEGTVKVESLEGPETARPGDWVVEDADSNVWVVADRFFVQRYEPVQGE